MVSYLLHTGKIIQSYKQVSKEKNLNEHFDRENHLTLCQAT